MADSEKVSPTVLFNLGEQSRRQRILNYEIRRRYERGLVQPQATHERRRGQGLSANLCKPIIDTYVGTFISAMPSVAITSTIERYRAVSNALTDIFQERIWQDQSILALLARIVNDAMVCNPGIAKLTWNPTYYGDPKADIATWMHRNQYQSADFGTIENAFEAAEIDPASYGEIQIGRVSPSCFGAEPGASSLEDCEFVYTRSSIPRRIALELYPEYGEEPKEPKMASMVKEATSIPLPWNSDERPSRLPLVEIWFDGGEKVATIIEDRIVDNIPNPYRYVNLPFSVFYSTVPEDDVFPEDALIEFAATIHDVINMELRKYPENSDLVGWPVLLDYRRDKSQKLIRRKGAVWNLDSDPSVDGPGLRYLETPKLPPESRWLVETLLQVLQFTTGAQDVLIGERPAGATSGVAIASLQEKSVQKMLPLRTLFHAGLQQMGEIMLGLAAQYYNDPKQRQDRIEPYIREEDKPAMEIDPQTRIPIETPIEYPDDFRAAYQVQVEPLSNFAVSQTIQAQQDLELMRTPAEDGRPLIDREAYLGKIKYPGRRAVMARARARNAPPIVPEASTEGNIPPEVVAQLQGQPTETT